ncbi:hypothetical protein VQ643_13070, partial [Pseudomonas sp. F1_0610]|uniref:hypothetical protein n=1 Tax=Pseudomonas sp. F1_0610 TaxID=3114284 RepID=UPI0039C4A1FC
IRYSPDKDSVQYVSYLIHNIQIFNARVQSFLESSQMRTSYESKIIVGNLCYIDVLVSRLFDYSRYLSNLDTSVPNSEDFSNSFNAFRFHILSIIDNEEQFVKEFNRPVFQ